MHIDDAVVAPGGRQGSGEEGKHRRAKPGPRPQGLCGVMPSAGQQPSHGPSGRTDFATLEPASPDQPRLAPISQHTNQLRAPHLQHEAEAVLVDQPAVKQHRHFHLVVTVRYEFKRNGGLERGEAKCGAHKRCRNLAYHNGPPASVRRPA